MSSVEGSGAAGPQDLQAYRQEYKQGVDLFQRALKEYSSADEVHKKDAFKNIMENALQVLNDSARGIKRPDLLQKNQQIAKDFQNFQDTGSSQAKNQLSQDLKQAQGSV
jgi:hypothetical protein